MADQLVTPTELATFLGQTWTDLSAAQQANLTLFAEVATAKVQDAAGGQRLVDLTTTAIIDVDLDQCGPWLDLPQHPVRAVTAVLIDGVADTAWRLRMQRLWRACGWNVNRSYPTQVSVTSQHGYRDGAQGLELARGYVLALGASAADNPTGVSAEQIDDYRVTYAQADVRIQVPDAMRDRLATAYGTTAFVTGG